ncbi:MAG: PD-(D/E)XK nuclease family protein [Synergistaceae bacterium]|jgi:hypothetical protein|nr:PD-(D/E)XK nuclease family protein [Synergistaceae bacterium]
MLKLSCYSKIHELKRIVCEKVESSARSKKIFMVPSMSSAEPLADMLRGPGEWFGDGPEIWSWAEMYARLSPERKRRRGIDLPDSRLVLAYILGGVMSNIESRGKRVPPGVRRRGFPDVLSSAVRELLLEDVEPDKLLFDDAAPSMNDLVLPHELLYGVYGDYLIYLEENGLADNSQMPSLTREAITAACPEYLNDSALYWIGFLSFTGAQLRLIKTMSGLGETWGVGFDMEFLSPHSGMEGFRDASEQLGLVCENRFERGGSIARMTSSNTACEYDGVADEIAGLLDGNGRLSDIMSGMAYMGGQFQDRENSDGIGSPDFAYDIGIMVDPSRIPLMEAALRRHGIPFQSRSEIMVSDTSVMDLCKRAWEAYRLAWPTAKTEHLCRHILFGVSAEDGQDGRTCPDPGKVLRDMPEGLRSWIDFFSKREGERGAAAIRSLERLNAFCAYLDDPGGHTGSELLSALLSMADDGEWESELSSIAGDDADMDNEVRSVASTRLEIAQKLDTMANVKPRIGPAGDLRFSGDGAADYLLDWGRSAGIALPQPRSGAVTLYDSTPPVLTAHDVWIMTDVDQNRFSGSAAEQPLLGADVRDGVNRIAGEASHLPTSHEKRMQREALFRRLLAVGGVLTLIVRSETDSQGRPQGDPPFVKSLLSDGESGWSDVGYVQVREDLSGAGGVDSPERRRLLRGTFPRAASHPRERMRRGANGKILVSASSIDDWISCPFMYWCGYIARVSPPADSAGLFDRRLQGTVMHRVWQAVWNSYISKIDAGGRSTLQGAFLSMWDRVISDMSGDYPVLADPRFSAPLARLKTNMSDVSALQDEIEARAGAAGLERITAKLEQPLPAYELRNISFSGRSDRIDIWRTPSGPVSVIVDYKLGVSGRYLGSLQLATYAAMMARASKSDAGAPLVAGFCYIGHADSCVRGGLTQELKHVYVESARKRGFDLDESVAAAVGAMDEMDSGLASGEFPARYDSDSCGICAHQTICRRSERLGFYESDEETAVDGQDE